MNCTCISDTETKLRGILEAKSCPLRPKKATGFKSVEIAGQALKLSGLDLAYNFSIGITVSWQMDSGTIKKTETSIAASFCPFCGKAITEEESNEPTPA